MFCEITNCCLKRANLGGAKLSQADLSDNSMEAARFVGCVALETKFRHSRINLADFGGADLSGADFFFAEARSKFENASLVGANLFGADLPQADFTRADLRKANMTDAKIARAVFTFAKMEGAIGTNGQPWGFAVRPKVAKKPWWKVWNGNAAL